MSRARGNGKHRVPAIVREADLMRAIQLEAPNWGTKLLRNNVGTGWVGASEFSNGSVFIRDARPLHAGLGTGTSDLIGWTKRQTENGPVAVFTAIEVKSYNGKLTLEQSCFLEAVRRDGGVAECVFSVEEAVSTFKRAAGIQEYTE